MNNIDITPLLVIVGTLMVTTNIITEVLKKVTWDKIPTNLLVVLIAQSLTLATAAAYAQINNLDLLWYHGAAAVVVGLFVAYLLVSQLFGRLIAWLKPDFFNANDQSVAAIAESHYIPTLICTVFLVPVAEECLHRGAVFGSLFQKNALLAYAVSTLVFSLVHINWMVGDPMILFLSFLQYIPAGLCLAAAYHISGSITAPILIHMAVNAIGILALR